MKRWRSANVKSAGKMDYESTKMVFKEYFSNVFSASNYMVMLDVEAEEGTHGQERTT